MESGFFKVF